MLENKENLLVEEEADEVLNMSEEDIIGALMCEQVIPEKTFKVDRLNIPIALRGIKLQHIYAARKECTKIKKVRGQQVSELNEVDFYAKLIEKASVSPDWNNPKLLKYHKASDGSQVIKKTFLAGELEALADNVLMLSNFDSELKEIENIKN